MTRRMVTLPTAAATTFNSEAGELRCRADSYGSVVVVARDRFNDDVMLYFDPDSTRSIAVMLLALADAADAGLGVRKRA